MSLQIMLTKTQNMKHLKNKNPIVPLDFKSLKKLPDSHTWPLGPDYPSESSDDPISLPEIDLLDPGAAFHVRRACESWGAFHVINHGVAVERVEAETRRLFALPAETKLRAVRSPEGGIGGYGSPRISEFFPKMMWSEGFSIFGSPHEHARHLWPEDHDHDHLYNFCNVMENYQNEMKQLCEKILDLILGSLGPIQENSKWAKPKNRPIKHSQALLQLNSYPKCPDPTRAMGLAPHTDSSLITLLHQSNGPTGLHVYREGTGWVRVHPVNGALVVNVGDLLQILSNGRFKSVLHRAVVSRTHHRVSIAYFYGPRRDVKVSPLIWLTDRDRPPLYRPITWKEYLDVKATHFNKALDLIKNEVAKY